MISDKVFGTIVGIVIVACILFLPIGVHADPIVTQATSDSTDYANHMRLVGEDNPDKLEADPMKMFPILVKAIQELSAEVESLKNP